MTKVTKTEIQVNCQGDAGQETPAERKVQRTDELRSAAVKEVPAMLKVLLDIANDQSGAAGPRVAAARAVCELAGQLGPAKEIPEALAGKDLQDMSMGELQEFIRQGREALNS